jgi:UDP-GlcNAc:undecaprenyl-phosphate GlcNAc-1-phosphate transferase
LLLLSATLVISTAAVWLLAHLAPFLGVVDTPGGRKGHSHPVPLVGGLAIFAAVLAVATFGGFAVKAAYFLLALSVIIAVGLWDDVTEVSPRLKFAIQIVASAIMIGGAGVELRTVGDLFGTGSVGLWIFAIPMTVFAVVGVVNSINMVDGMDGLGGSLALVAFAWYSAVAAASGLEVHLAIGLIFCGAIAGFLVFNLRFPWQRHARVFLGDAGSLMIGFALGWFAIDLTQGPGRSFAPIAALWVLLLPLVDCVSLMLRRIAAGKSPFLADNHHIHHYLLARGFSHGQTLGTLVGLSILFGAVGFGAWRLGIADSYLFWPFFFGFFAYHLWIGRAFRKLDERRMQMETAAFAAPPLPEDTGTKKAIPTS